MKLRIEDKTKAINLRLGGKTYSEIRKIIPGLSKSTLSGWMRYVSLSPTQEKILKENIKKNIYNAQIKSGWQKKQKRMEQIDSVKKQAKKELPSLLKNPLFIVGLSLYWAEGSKKSREQIQFSNSDPEMIKIMMRWFKEICAVPIEKIKIHIYIHKIYENEHNENFWSSITDIPVQKFGKTTYKPTTHNIKKNPEYRGLCRIEINNVNLFRKIMGWQEGFSKILE